ncbi:GNAT family N-acetyltransferase [Peribacillus kribbensis]|uniref:GNAT family N-acetyltransferase n=1 Tax=Peribacillus kribbensis TaxID=356658 RepID=UPI00041363E8|nr:GNAT family N-acetyltransferase [Peribacillus kribbensis]
MFTKPVSHYYISTDKKLIDFDKVYKFLKNESYWAADVTRERVAVSIENSICFGVYEKGTDRLAGFARVITDSATFAYLCDLFVLPEDRGNGLSKFLVKTIVTHKDFSSVRRILLATKDAQTLYSRFGFVDLDSGSRFMQLQKTK